MKAPPTSSEPNGARILALCDELARHSSQPNGLTRMFLSREQAAVSQVVLGWMRDVGMSARIDAIGNVVGRYEGTQPGLPALVLGSHLDTVRDAGKYDGPLGVVAAIECVRALHARGKRFDFAIEIYGFADEEGVRFGATLLGSRAVAGTFRPANLDTRDRSGITMRQAMEDAGLDPDQLPAAIRRRDEVLAYVELHIEQGPVLEGMDLPLGVVIGTYGCERHGIRFTGQAAHAGSTPMDRRRDAFGAAAKLGLEIREIARRHGGVCTVGSCKTLPGIVTAVVGQCDITLDQRHMDAAHLQAMMDEAKAASERFAAEEGCTVEWSHIWRIEPIYFDATLQDFCEEAVREVSGTAHRLPSGPLHDAAETARVGVPTVMMFTQSLRGISHNKIEDTKEEHLAMSVDALDRLARRTMAWIASQ